MFVSCVYQTLGLVGGIFTSGQNILSGEAAVHCASTVTGRNDIDATPHTMHEALLHCDKFTDFCVHSALSAQGILST